MSLEHELALTRLNVVKLKEAKSSMFSTNLPGYLLATWYRWSICGRTGFPLAPSWPIWVLQAVFQQCSVKIGLQSQDATDHQILHWWVQGNLNYTITKAQWDSLILFTENPCDLWKTQKTECQFSAAITNKQTRRQTKTCMGDLHGSYLEDSHIRTRLWIIYLSLVLQVAWKIFATE